jgi:hypothetical protein
MSADPLLDQLRASIPEAGKLTLDALSKFIGDALKVDDNFFGFSEVDPRVINRSYTSTVFYSGSLGPEAGGVYTGEIGRDLANRSGGQVRILDNTKIGRLLIEITQGNGLAGFPLDGAIADFNAQVGSSFWRKAVVHINDGFGMSAPGGRPEVGFRRRQVR